jgi:ferric-dicitrate binding protein FerR (iron transport regulator)
MKPRSDKRNLAVAVLGCTLFASALTAYGYRHQAADFVRLRLERSTGSEKLPTAGALVVANQVAVITPQGIVTQTVTPEELARRVAWSPLHGGDGWLSFQGETLELAVAEFNLHNRRKLIIQDPKIARVQVGGMFLVGDTDGFTQALRKTHDIKASQSRAPDGSEVITLTK